MSRPDPRFVLRTQPSGAEAGTTTPDADRLPLRLWGDDGRLDHDGVRRLVNLAEIIVQGRVFQPGANIGAEAHSTDAVFLGTALLIIDMNHLTVADAPVSEAFVLRLRGAMARDRRTLRPLRDLAWRETARLLGPDTPYNLEVTATLRARGTALLIDLDLEGHVKRDPVEREIVDAVSSLRDAGLSIRGIAAELAARGVHRPESKTHH